MLSACDYSGGLSLELGILQSDNILNIFNCNMILLHLATLIYTISVGQS